MPRRSSIAGLLALLFAASCLLFGRAIPASAARTIHERKRDARREIEDMEQQWRKAQLAQDVPAMDRLLSEDYVGISMIGQISTKAQQLDRLRNRSLVLTRIDLSDVKVKLLGSVAIVTSLASVDGTNEGVSMSGLYRYTRVYHRLPSGDWKITNFEATRVPRRDHRHHADENNQDTGDAPPPSPGPPSA